MPERWTAEDMTWDVSRCPKRHGQAAHLLDCPPDELFPYVRGAVIKYRGKMGLSWIAWAGHDDYYNEVWYCQRRDSVHPSAPRAVSHAELLEEIGTLEDVMRGDNDGG